MHSVWSEGSLETRVGPALRERIQADVVVVGAGITGLMTAWYLHQAGRSVAVVEAGTVGASNTGHSTGNLYATVSQGLAPLRRKWGDEVTGQVVRWRTAAMQTLLELAHRHDPDGPYASVPLLRAAHRAEEVEALEEERQACEAAGLVARWDDGFPLPARALRLEGQAQVNPYRLAQALARHLAGEGVRIFEHTRALDADASDGCVVTDQGRVDAPHLVFATHTPKGFNLVQAEMEPYREYGVAARSGARALPEGIFWLKDEGRSFRRYGHDADSYVVVVGEFHKTGQGEPEADYLARLEGFATERLQAGEVTHRWSAQQYRSADGLPYIGRSAHHNVYIATGFAADGLTWGALAGRVIASLVQEQEDDAARLFTPRRFTPVKSAGTWLRENADVVEHLTVDYFRRAGAAAIDALGEGQGAIVEVQGHARAVYRAPGGEVVVLSCVCPHLKCKVGWNRSERTWDCPCHGSRFDAYGRVIEGPAWSDLKRF